MQRQTLNVSAIFGSQAKYLSLWTYLKSKIGLRAAGYGILTVLLAGIGSIGSVNAQIILPQTGTTTITSLTYDELVIPPGVGTISFEVRGGDGGEIGLTGTCDDVKGGSAATMKVTYPVGDGNGELQPGGRLRVYGGRAGEDDDASCLNGINLVGGGGGSSAVLYQMPENGDTWELLVVAGGGGGANRPIGGTRLEGKGGRIIDQGGDVFSSFVDKRPGNKLMGLEEIGGTCYVLTSNLLYGYGYYGGTVACQPMPGYEYVEAGGTMAAGVTAWETAPPLTFSASGFVIKRLALSLKDDSEAINMGGIKGWSHGGDGFTGGGVGFHGGGGGGGSSGGAAVGGQAGGGGGSWISSQFTPSNIEKIAGSDGGGTSSNGFVKITTFINQLPVVACNDLTVSLDNGSVYVPFSSLATGSYSLSGNELLFTSSDAQFEGVSFGCSDVGDQRVSFIVQETNTNYSEPCNVTVTVQDNTPLVATCQNVTVQLDASGRATLTAGKVDNGSSDGCGIVDRSLSTTHFDCTDVGFQTVTLTITDVDGNVASCEATVTVEDNVAPVANCKDLTVQIDASGLASIVASDVNNNSYDACGIASLSLDKTSFTCADKGDNTVNLTVTDSNGNVSSCEATVTVVDQMAPTLTCPSNVNVSVNTGNCSYIPKLENNNDLNLAVLQGVHLPAPGTVIDNCFGLVVTNNFTGTGPILSGAEFPMGTNTVTYTVTDAENYVKTCSFTVTVEDNVSPPKVDATTCPPQFIDVTVPAGSCGHVINFDTPTFTDCQDFTVTQIGGYPSGTEFPAGTTIFSFQAIDELGNRSGSVCTTTVTIEEADPPVALCKNELTVTIPNSWPYKTEIKPVDLNDGSYDACGGDVDLFIQSGAYLTFGRTFDCSDTDPQPVTLVVVDHFGNSSTCTTLVRVDDQQPVAQCRDISVNVGGGNQTINPAAVFAGGDYSYCASLNPPTLSLDQNTFGCADIGVQTVTLTLTDPHGAVSSCTSQVTVFDGGVTTLNCGPVIQVQLEAGEQTTIDISGHYSASDACGAVTVSAAQDLVTIGCDNYGETLIPVTATDGNGNTRTCNVRIHAYSDWKPVSCNNITVQLDQNGEAIVNHRDLYAFSEPCANAPDIADYDNLRYLLRAFGGPGDGNDFELYEDYFITYTAENLGLNAPRINVYDLTDNPRKYYFTCTATVTVEQNLLPVAVCRNAAVTLDDSGTFTLSPEMIDDGSYDESGPLADLTLDISDLTCSQVGSNTVTLTVTDIHGGSSNCTATVTVTDDTAPTANCQNVTVQLDANGNGSTSAQAVDNGSSDACGIASLSLDNTSFSCADLGANTVTLTVTDANGNVGSCNATVTVVDGNSPVALCQNIAVTLETTGTVSISGADIDGGSMDNCSIAGRSVSTNIFGTADVGDNTVTLTVTDPSGNTDNCQAIVTVRRRPVAITYTGDTEAQYSDQAGLSAILTDQLTGNPVAGRELTFSIGGKNAKATTDEHGRATASIVLDQKPSGLDGASYTIDMDFTPAAEDWYDASSQSNPFTITREDPLVTYTGVLFASTGGANSSEAVLTLSATIQDDADSYPGDVSNAKVQFYNSESGVKIGSPLDVVLVNANDPSTGTVLYNWTVDMGNQDVESYEIGIEVLHYYERATQADEVITVAKPLDDYVRGGGRFFAEGSEGAYAAGEHSSVRFSINGKYTKNGKKPKGKAHFLVDRLEADGIVHTYRFKSNRIHSVGINPATNEGQVTGKCTVEDVTDPNAPVSLGGNNTFQFDVQDNGTPGTLDLIGMAVYEDDGALLFSSQWDGTRTVYDHLDKGDIEVQSSAGRVVIANNRSVVRTITPQPALGAPAELSVFPNPFASQATIRFYLPESGRVTLQVFNLQGQLVRSLNTGWLDAGEHQQQWDGTDAGGAPLASGLYLIRLRIGEEVLTRKAVLQRF